MMSDRGPRIPATALGILLALVPLFCARAQSDAARYVTAAEGLFEALEYERALEQLAQARRLPRSLADDVRIALFEGLILSDMGQSEAASVAFKAGLLLDPDAQLPVRASPKVEQRFEEIRGQVHKELKARERKSQETHAEASSRTDRPEAPQVELVPVSAPRPWLPSSVRVAGVSVPTPSLALLGASVLAGGVGGFLGLRSRGQLQDARDASYQQEMSDYRDEAQGNARVANILFGAAGLLATGAVVTWWVSDSEQVSTGEAAR